MKYIYDMGSYMYDMGLKKILPKMHFYAIFVNGCGIWYIETYEKVCNEIFWCFSKTFWYDMQLPANHQLTMFSFKL